MVEWREVDEQSERQQQSASCGISGMCGAHPCFLGSVEMVCVLASMPKTRECSGIVNANACTASSTGMVANPLVSP